MRRSFLFPLIYGALLYAWFFNIYAYYFDFSLASQIGLALSLITSLLLSFRFLHQFNQKWVWIKVSLLFCIPIVIFPILTFWLSRFNQTWLILHFSLAICATIAPSLEDLKKSFLPTVAVILVWWLPFDFGKTQLKFFDKVVASSNSESGTAQIVKWKNDYWLHYNDQLIFSTLDSHIIQEAFVEPVLHLGKSVRNVLVIGGDSHLVIDQLSKHKVVDEIVVVPTDPDLYKFVSDNKHYFSKSKNSPIQVTEVVSINNYLSELSTKFDLIVIDLPTPQSTGFDNYKQTSFFSLCNQKLDSGGHLIVRGKNLYQKLKSSNEVIINLQKAGFHTLKYHTQVPSMGEVSWIIASKKYSELEMKEKLRVAEPTVPTKWWSNGAMNMMLSFGKEGYPHLEK